MSSPWPEIVRTLLLAAGMAGFALCVHRDSLIVPCILCAGLVIGVLVKGMVVSKSLSSFFGGALPERGIVWLYCLPVSIGLGLGFGIFYRVYQAKPYFPDGLALFGIVALCIGICEELLYRGVMLGWLDIFPPAAASLCAAAAHGLYKISLFILTGPGGGTDLVRLGLFTAGLGFLIGIIRIRSGSVWFPVMTHGIFDLLVYGDCQSAPWWVW